MLVSIANCTLQCNIHSDEQNKVTSHFFQGCFILYEVGKFQVSGLIIIRYMFLSQTTHFFISGKCHCPKKTRTNTHRFPVAKMRSGLGRCNDDSVLPQDTDKIIPPLCEIHSLNCWYIPLGFHSRFHILGEYMIQ